MMDEVYLPGDDPKINFVGEVPVTDKPGGKVIGKAKLEKLGNDSIVAHIALDPEHAAAIFTGFKLGSYSIGDGDASTT